MREPTAKHPTLRNPPTEGQMQADAAMREADGGHFIDFERVLSANPAGCKHLILDGALISYDGEHLTRVGAV